MNAIPRQKCFPSDPNVTFVPMIFGGERGMDNCGEEICGGDIPEEYKVSVQIKSQSVTIYQQRSSLASMNPTWLTRPT